MKNLEMTIADALVGYVVGPVKRRLAEQAPGHIARHLVEKGWKVTPPATEPAACGGLCPCYVKVGEDDA